jgi:serine/threonine protein kinase
VIDGPTAEDEARLNIKFNSHPHILHTYGLVKNDLQSIMLLQEQAPYGNLQALLQSENFEPSPNVLVAIFLQIVDAMIYISRQNIAHGDLRCANILVFQMDSSEPTECLVKLTNFSLARTKNQPLANNRLPDSYVRYCAPEILRNEDGSAYTELSDVYSMGALMYEACSKGEAPYGRRTSDRDVRQQRLNNTELEQPKECHNQIWSVIEDCCRNERSRRLTFEELNIRLSKIDIK